MLFTSPEFLFGFLPLIIGGSIFIGVFKSERLSILYLVCGSLFFYGWWNIQLLPLLLFSIIINFSIGHYLLKYRKKSLLFFGIFFNLALIIIFKYLDFSIFTINLIFSSNFYPQNIVLPLAISFFTFQQIAYLSDVYIGRTSDPSFLKYALFVTFFPQLIAGPIVHHSEMIPQFTKKKLFKITPDNLWLGAEIFSIGLFKKLIIADGIAPYSDEFFNAVTSGVAPSFFDAWGGSLAYTIQIYFDFSGYSDMAIGLAWVFGVKLPLNFASPYKANNIIEFWQRWHMTLSRFLKEYVYIPFGGNRRGIPRRYLNILITMLLGGLWHGAAWTFVAWGLLHAFYIIINHAWRYVVEKNGWQKLRFNIFYRIGCWLLTFWCIVIGWMFFRSDNFETGFQILRGSLGFNGIFWPDFFNSQVIHSFGNFGSELLIHGDVYLWIFIFMTILVILPNTQQIIGPWSISNSRLLVLFPEQYHVRLRQFLLIPFCLSTLIIGSLIVLGRGQNLGNFIYMVF